MKKVSTHEAKTHLSRLLAEVAAGEEIIICKGSVPAARLVPVQSTVVARRRPHVGERTSPSIEYAPDAFAPLTPEELRDWGIE